MGIVLGAIADDTTGATDLANNWVKSGVKVIQTIGIPGDEVDLDGAQAVVVALKSRSAPTKEAITQSLIALKWLRDAGAQQVMFKYCSTFDSTDKGNIGPVADALLDAVEEDFALVCPAFPDTGRTVYKGHLFVWEQLLSESPMKDHPLNPMRESDLTKLMDRQSRHSSGLINLQTVRGGHEAIASRIQELRESGLKYGIADAVDNQDLLSLGLAVSGHLLVTGGSGIGLGLPQNHRSTGKLPQAETPTLPVATGREVVIAGSCSEATRMQVREFSSTQPSLKIDVEMIAEKESIVQDTVDWALAQDLNGPVMIYTSADPQEVLGFQEKYGVEKAGGLVEKTLGEISIALRGEGFNRMVVAGGEVSGAVVKALGVRALRIGPEITPGVPWTESVESEPLALALKSGNFGDKKFFSKAFSMLA